MLYASHFSIEVQLNITHASFLYFVLLSCPVVESTKVPMYLAFTIDLHTSLK